jgi:hypothetical protein
MVQRSARHRRVVVPPVPAFAKRSEHPVHFRAFFQTARLIGGGPGSSRVDAPTLPKAEFN